MIHLHRPSFLIRFPFILAFVLGCELAVGDEAKREVREKPEVSDQKKPKKFERGAHRGSDHQGAFQEADINQDGFLTVEEFGKMQRLARLEPEKRKRLFLFLDKNKDGKLHHGELHPTAPSHFGHMLKQFERIDADGNGVLTPDEVRKLPLFKKTPAHQFERLFSKMDRNNNGKLEKSELSKHVQRVKPAIDFGRHDEDKSGGLSFQEYSTLPMMSRVPEIRRKRTFEHIDANKDGQLSPEEIRKAKPPRKHRDHRNGPGGLKRDGARRTSGIF